MVVCCIWIFCSTTIIGWAVFEHIPHVQDSIAQFFQAKIFAGGSLTAAPPPVPDFFRYFYDNIIITQNKWYSQYPPGHPFFLMFGVLLGAPWLINPLAAACSVILLYKIALQFYGQQEAKLSVLLFSCSPFVLFMSASFMNHATTLFCLLLFVYCLNKSHTTKRLVPSFLGGVALGIMFTIRPGDACAVGAVFVSVYIFSMIRKKSFPPLLAFGFGLALMLCVMLLYNYATTGDPLLFGYEVRWGKAHSLGFSGNGVYRGRPHTPLQGLGQTVSNLAAFNQSLFEWPLPSLFWIIILFSPVF